jgi:hypothetical protein
MRPYTNHVGVWMDHHQAHFIYQKSKGEYEMESMESSYNLHPCIEGEEADGSSFGKNRDSNGEYKKHTIEHGQLHDYYKKLATVLENYDEILLFGPTTAKEELFNILFADKAFKGIRITIENSDKMTANQMMAFTKKYFENTLV